MAVFVWLLHTTAVTTAQAMQPRGAKLGCGRRVGGVWEGGTHGQPRACSALRQQVAAGSTYSIRAVDGLDWMGEDVMSTVRSPARPSPPVPPCTTRTPQPLSVGWPAASSTAGKGTGARAPAWTTAAALPVGSAISAGPVGPLVHACWIPPAPLLPDATTSRVRGCGARGKETPLRERGRRQRRVEAVCTENARSRRRSEAEVRSVRVRLTSGGCAPDACACRSFDFRADYKCASYSY